LHPLAAAQARAVWRKIQITALGKIAIISDCDYFARFARQGFCFLSRRCGCGALKLRTDCVFRIIFLPDTPILHTQRAADGK